MKLKAVTRSITHVFGPDRRFMDRVYTRRHEVTVISWAFHDSIETWSSGKDEVTDRRCVKSTDRVGTKIFRVG